MYVGTATTTNKPMITVTSMSSISVKPRLARQDGDLCVRIIFIFLALVLLTTNDVSGWADLTALTKAFS
jgi:hypothetical protein